ncbi:hypothetical protein AQ490_22105 [Wenjunlia vitaminophila]|uniref:pPIWI-RE three-gene island domain-containing protein n=1 Tax=Wenjunlia vitaminophila TaxID=76728 RepID=A0A0T6LT52_WENVI|nr:hypothetical protein [Wenjunlia vitaminophila]KRV49010.1 hypothetical protein AQ490_22105 [Wenjunlia vitaminophila]
MRDRSQWHESLARDLGPWPEEHSTVTPVLLCQVELGLRLLEVLDDARPANGVWTLLGGYPFARALGIAPTASERLALAAARHLLWPMRRRRVWEQCLETYLGLPERLRGYRVPAAGGPARRVDPPVASHRFAVYDAALGDLPPFIRKPLPQAGAGSYRFLDRQRHASVRIPDDVVLPPADGHDLVAGRPDPSSPLDVPRAELAKTARWMDAEEERRGLPRGHWRRRLEELRLQRRTDDGISFTNTDHLRLDQLTHLVGMVGAGKSTLMTLVAVWAHRRGLRTTLVVGDVAEQLFLTELFRGLGLTVALVQGGSTREQHTQRLHRRLAARGERSLLRQTSKAFDHLSTACPLDALRGLDSATSLRYVDAPCGGLHPVRHAATPTSQTYPLFSELERLRARRDGPGSHRTPPVEAHPLEADSGELRDPHSCPLWSACPRHRATRELADALIWVANPASLVQTAVPRQMNAERLRYLELACLRSNIVIVDEADRVQMQLDQIFAPSATLVRKGPESWLDRLQTREIAELSRQGRLPLSERDVERWSAALDVVSSATNRLYAMLIRSKELRDWAQIDYFSAWTLQERLLQEWYPSPEPVSEEMVEEEVGLYDDEDDTMPPDRGTPVSRDPCAARREEINRLLDGFRDDPLGDRGPRDPTTDALTRLAHDLLHTLNESNSRERVRNVLDGFLTGAPGPDPQAAPTPPTGRGARPTHPRLGEAWRERAAHRLEFMIIVAVLHHRLNRVIYLWPQVEAALRLDTGDNDLARRPPLDYAPVVPEAPMGNVLGFQYLLDDREKRDSASGLRTGTLRFFRCAGVGRELLLSLPQLGADPGRGRPGPNVLLMSGTSWAGTSTRAHVLAPVSVVLQPQEEAVRAVRDTEIRTLFLYDDEGRPIRLSGQDLDDRPDVLRLMITKLARPGRGGNTSPLQRELAQIPDDRRRRALLLVGSYREAGDAADLLNEIPRWRGHVRVLAADDAELGQTIDGTPTAPGRNGQAGVVRRGDLASFAHDDEAELLVAPLLAIERGHNILTVPRRPGEKPVAAFGTVLFLVRPHPRPDDLTLAVFAINDWATRFVRDHPGLTEGTFSELIDKAGDLDTAGQAFRATARRVWRHLLCRPYIYSALSDNEKRSFAWDQLVTIWQVIGRLVRGGVPARVVMVDAAFAPALALRQAPGGPAAGRARWLRDQGLLFRLREVLAPYFAADAAPGLFPDPADPALVRMLYQPLYEALLELDTHPDQPRFGVS